MVELTYMLKKGLQYYPPCLNQVLTLDDLDVELNLISGENSKYVKSILDNRKIKTKTFLKEKMSSNRIESAVNFVRFSREMHAIEKQIKKDEVLWIGNMQTALSLDKNFLKSHCFILNVLELYDDGTIIDRWLKKNIHYAKRITCCEKHRAAIMQCRYNLDSLPIVIPNKPYDIANNDISLSENIRSIITQLKDKFCVVYQGMIAPDRPLDKIVNALAILNEDIVFVVMGDCSEVYKKYLRSIYNHILFTGYIPAPQHLIITQCCSIGIANYDTSNLNNVFCAPNKIYEYSKFGIPILASQNLALIETVGAYNAGLCIDYNDIMQIAKAICLIRDNYKKYSDGAKAMYQATDTNQPIKYALHELFC